ncbi:two-component system, chemotaxis family, sensor kinase CheA [Caminicella sporogenes DSM 14501]|uniref:Chemotaxis protein CheA n=1 Tax=Caminicella sporogenes DSM 14501 TaxID=1121266 RepID=A0A1M6NIM2_9FIRM|nr:chemotaxis protein CheA [Caminicella sporogenes]RKD22193.1 hypothetical protein BET04_06115 [Caminicella sporogenes]SHJ95412.1 two-component system, chemotaxis family, sensor kinase CheA [Caminicella sporogenes DSM 14501]
MDKFDMNDIYYSMFLEETKEQIEKIEQDLLILESGQDDIEIVNEIFRMAHSIKGASATMGLENMSKLAHHLENLLSKVRSKEISVDTNIINIFFKGIDILKQMHYQLSRGKEYDENIEGFIKEIQMVINTIEDKGYDKEEANLDLKSKDEQEIVEEKELDLEKSELKLIEGINPELNIYKIIILMNEDMRMKSVKAFLIVNNLLGISDIIKTVPAEFEKLSDSDFGNKFKLIIATNREYEAIYENINSISEIKKIYIKRVRERRKEDVRVPKNVKIVELKDELKKKEISTIRVDISKIDKLLNLVGEFIIDKENLNQISIELKRKYKNDLHVNKLLNVLSHINYIGSELQETVMSTRMLPLEHIFNRFPRMVRDLAKRFDKNIKFIIEGKETEIDRGIIEELLDPLTHILRNSIDHGFESCEERKRTGKDEVGILKLSARHEENNVVIEIEDDGRGINIDKIKEKVLERSLATEEELKKLSDKDILQFIFEPGFSTAEKVTDISGRGVGLDVVKSNISKLNGIIDIKTEKGKGTKFIIRLPLTLAIVQALLIKEGEYIFAIPISSIIEMIRLKGREIEERIHKIDNLEVFDWRNQAIPVIRVGEYFGIAKKTDSNKLFIVVVGYLEKRFAFIVSKLMGEQEIVIKSMGEFIGNGKLFGNIKGISGVSILGDGSFAQIIDVASMSKK